MRVTSIKQAQKKIASLQRSTARARAKAGEVAQHTLEMLEITGSAFGFGLLKGYRGETTIFGVPADLVAGVGLHAFALFGVGGNMENHFRAVGNGALAAYAHTAGAGIGNRQANRSVQGEYPYQIQGESITSDDLADLAYDAEYEYA